MRRRRRGDERSSEAVRLGDVVEGLLSERSLAQGLPIGRLAADWATVVGDRLASETAPLSIAGGVLTVAATAGPWGAQARFLAAEIRTQANRALGGEPIREVRVVVRPDLGKSLPRNER